MYFYGDDSDIFIFYILENCFSSIFAFFFQPDGAAQSDTEFTTSKTLRLVFHSLLSSATLLLVRRLIPLINIHLIL